MNQNGSTSNTVKYKLIYFDERGKADLIKLILKVTDQEYENIQIKSHEW